MEKLRVALGYNETETISFDDLSEKYDVFRRAIRDADKHGLVESTDSYKKVKQTYNDLKFEYLKQKTRLADAEKN